MARKILLADDSVTAQNMGRRILSDAGYEVVTVNNGSAALKKIPEENPDLVILDVYMPGYGGVEVCQRIKDSSATAHIPVLLTVGKLEPFKAEEARRVHADAHLVKPFEASELLAALIKLEDKIVPRPEPRPAAPAKSSERSAARRSEPPSSEKEVKFGDAASGWKDRLKIPNVPKTAPAPAPAASTAFRKIEHVPTAELAPENRPRSYQFGEGFVGGITAEEIAAIAAAAAACDETGETTDSPAPEVETAPMTAVRPAVSTAIAPESPLSFESPYKSFRAIVELEKAAQAQAVAEVESPVEPEPAAAPQPVAEFESRAEPEVAAETHPAAEPESVAEVEPIAMHEPVADVEPVSLPQPEPAAAMEGLQNFEAAAHIETPLVEAVAQPAGEVEGEIPPAEKVADAEVFAALESLVPVNGNSGVDFPGAGHASHSEPMTGVSRWVADEVPLSAEEITCILEEEMQKAYAALTQSGLMGAAPDAAPAEATAWSSPGEPQPSPYVEYSRIAEIEQAQPQVAVASAAALEPQSDIAPVEFHEETPARRHTWADMAWDDSAAQRAEPAADFAAPELAETDSTSNLPEEIQEPFAEPAPPMAASAEADLATGSVEPMVSAAEAAAAAPFQPEPWPNMEHQVAASAAPLEAGAIPSEAASVEETSSADAPPMIDSMIAAVNETIAAEAHSEAALAAAASGGFEFRSISHEGHGAETAAAEPGAASASSTPAEVSPEREAELAAAWQHWKQIRDSIAGPQFTAQVAEVAAASLSDSAKPAASSSKSETEAEAIPADPAAIASIVESVLADLKPRLVAEIAKKLGKEK